MQSIAERITARYINGEEELCPHRLPKIEGVINPAYKASGFQLYPLYNENDMTEHVLVEFEPFGFLYIMITDKQFKAFK